MYNGNTGNSIRMEFITKQSGVGKICDTSVMMQLSMAALKKPAINRSDQILLIGYLKHIHTYTKADFTISSSMELELIPILLNSTLSARKLACRNPFSFFKRKATP